ARPALDPQAAVVDPHVAVGHADVDRPGVERVAVAGRARRQRPDAVEDGRKEALPAGGQVQDDDDRHLQVVWQTARDRLQRLDAARGGADDDEVVPALSVRLGHASLSLEPRPYGDGTPGAAEQSSCFGVSLSRDTLGATTL